METNAHQWMNGEKKNVKYMGDGILFSLFLKSGDGDERNGELIVNGDRVSVWEGGKALDGGDGSEIM